MKEIDHFSEKKILSSGAKQSFLNIGSRLVPHSWTLTLVLPLVSLTTVCIPEQLLSFANPCTNDRYAVATTPAQCLAADLTHFTRHISLPHIGEQIGLYHILFRACSAFTLVAGFTLAGLPEVIRCIVGFSHFVISMNTPITSGWNDSWVGL